MLSPHRRCVNPVDKLSVSAANVCKLAFWKFHLRTGLPAAGLASEGTLMTGGRWCYPQNMSMTCRSRNGSPWWQPTNARSKLVWVFHLEKQKLGGSLGSNRSVSSSGVVWEYPHLVCWQLKSHAYKARAWTCGRAEKVSVHSEVLSKFIGKFDCYLGGQLFYTSTLPADHTKVARAWRLLRMEPARWNPSRGRRGCCLLPLTQHPFVFM